MLQQPAPDDYVVATGEMHSVREFVEEAFRLVGLDWQDHVEIDPRYFRPTEVDELCGDATKARERLGWTPRTSFPELVRIMVAGDLEERGLDPAAYLVREDRQASTPSAGPGAAASAGPR
jgi:GDPmannose 4,6-dehydratase